MSCLKTLTPRDEENRKPNPKRHPQINLNPFFLPQARIKNSISDPDPRISQITDIALTHLSTKNIGAGMEMIFSIENPPNKIAKVAFQLQSGALNLHVLYPNQKGTLELTEHSSIKTSYVNLRRPLVIGWFDGEENHIARFRGLIIDICLSSDVYLKWLHKPPEHIGPENDIFSLQ